MPWAGTTIRWSRVACFEERLGIIHLAMWGDCGYDVLEKTMDYVAG
jgi:hypothetical protein